MIQEAVDYDLDLSFFVEQFKIFFDSISKLGEIIPDGSPLAKIVDYIKQIDVADEAQRKVLIDELKPYVLEVFKKNARAQIDVRDKEKENLTVPLLLQMFEKASVMEFDNPEAIITVPA